MCEIGVSTLEKALVRAEELFQKKGQCKIKTAHCKIKLN